MRPALIIVIAVSLVARILVASLRPSFGGEPISWLPYAVPWDDFYTIYGQQLIDLSRGLLPYKDFVYAYPPLFLYTLYPFFYLGGINLAASPILLADAFTGPLIYTLVRSKVSEKIAIAVGLGYALTPFVLFTEGYLWLSSQPMTLFIILSLCFLQKDRLWLSQMMLGLSALFKQEALFIFPVYALYYAKKYHVSMLKGIRIALPFVILVTLPFLIIAPTQYIAYVGYDLLRYFLPVTKPSSAPVVTHALLTNASLLSVTYSGYNTSPLAIASELFGFASIFAIIPLFAILSCSVILFAKIEKFEILAAYSLIVLLLIFWIVFHQTFMYYYVPVYALLFASSSTKLTTSAAIAVPTIALFLPEGPAQLVMSMLGIFVILLATTTNSGFGNLGKSIFSKLHSY
jgi:Gpi18-like mannosyltransferase